MPPQNGAVDQVRWLGIYCVQKKREQIHASCSIVDFKFIISFCAETFFCLPVVQCDKANACLGGLRVGRFLEQMGLATVKTLDSETHSMIVFRFRAVRLRRIDAMREKMGTQVGKRGVGEMKVHDCA